ILLRVLPDAASAGADRLADADLLARYRRELTGALPHPRIASDAREVRVMGRRALEDAVALQALIPPLTGAATPSTAADVIPRAMGALGAAAMVGGAGGGETARAALLGGLPATSRAD